MVGEVADGIQRLLSGAGGDQHALAAQIVGQGQLSQHILQQILGLGHFAGTHGAAGQTAAGGLDDFPAVAAQGLQIVLGHGVFEHIGVHGRGNQLGALAGQYGGGEHIVGQTVGQFGADVGGGRGDEHQIGALGQRDMLYLMAEVAVKGVHHGAAAGELLEGQGGDELGGMLGHHHLYGSVLFYQSGSQCGGLIGGDAAGDTQQNGLSTKHSGVLLDRQKGLPEFLLHT